jgi:MoxR-like ATPase
MPDGMSSPRVKLDSVIKKLSDVVLDKDREVRLAMTCLIADGHLLIEDIPGVGKTTLVKALSALFGFKASRIQFTNDLLPGDIVGNSIFDPIERRFQFHPGPIFSQLVLGDELNRATPKTQSACLQAMEERRVTIDGQTHGLPRPFFFIATQNPRQQIGTFPLPESQLDRFMMRIELGYPSRAAEKSLLLSSVRGGRTDLIESLTEEMRPEDLIEAQKAARSVFVSDQIVEYVQDLVARSRELVDSRGLSPRGALSLVHAAQSWAFLHHRQLVLPEDVQAVAVAVMSHRLNPTEDLTGETGLRSAKEILSSVRVD